MARSFTAVVVALLAISTVVASGHRLMITGAGSDAKGHWDDARATFYGDIKGGETMQGACGYGNLFVQGYGLETTALSSVLFNNGATCGACFEIQCVNAPQSCIKGARSIFVTATNFCPPNYTKTVGVWCNPPQKHFDLSLPMFLKIAKYKAGVVPVKFRRVLCPKKYGGVKFQLSGNPYFLMVLVYDVGHVGVVAEVKVKGSKTGWIPMHRNWGQVWDTGMKLTGQSLSFKVATSDGRCLDFHDVAPFHWQFNQAFDGKINF
ncbi:Expansin-A23 [Cardamine amara subsp. amara]|uniref:Expansin n=1 Tax=Cardamine amara subsp. amara TaxID=228776 RepID=A0ABD1AGI4_CARAN